MTDFATDPSIRAQRSLTRSKPQPHPALPLIWALVWCVVPAFWAGTLYWIVQALY